jgi:hypothetical protein
VHIDKVSKDYGLLIAPPCNRPTAVSRAYEFLASFKYLAKALKV